MKRRRKRKTYQSSKLSGKYSYNISADSSGLPLEFCPPALPGPQPIVDGLDNDGLCKVSELVDRLGLRSSSESERLIGSVGAPRGILDGVMGLLDERSGVVGANLSPVLEDIGLSDPHEGTGGRPRPGDIASFLLVCAFGFGDANACGVDQSVVCCRRSKTRYQFATHGLLISCAPSNQPYLYIPK